MGDFLQGGEASRQSPTLGMPTCGYLPNLSRRCTEKEITYFSFSLTNIEKGLHKSVPTAKLDVLELRLLTKKLPSLRSAHKKVSKFLPEKKPKICAKGAAKVAAKATAKGPAHMGSLDFLIPLLQGPNLWRYYNYRLLSKYPNSAS